MSDPPVACCHIQGAHTEPIDVWDWLRIGIGVLVAGWSMTFTLAINTSEASDTERFRIHLALLGTTAFMLLMLGGPLITRAARALRAGRLTVEFMFLAGILGALGASLVATFGDHGDVYYEVVTILLVVYAIGQRIGEASQKTALRSAEAWAPELLTCELVQPDGSTRRTPVSDVTIDQVVIVYPGQMIPIDGVVHEGEAFVREAEMTGEFFSATRRPGDAVYAGTHCVDGTLHIRTTVDGAHRQIDAIVDAVAAARSRPSRFQTQADRLMTWFLPSVLTASLATFCGWTAATDWTRGLFNAMAVLLVACPCALGFATPVAIWAALGRLARQGLVVRGGDIIEKLAAVDTVVFDKTGTLTELRAQLLDFVVARDVSFPEARLRAAIAAVQRQSNHPVAAAFWNISPAESITPRVDDLRIIPGTGVSADVHDAELGRILHIEIGAAERLASADDESRRLQSLAEHARARHAGRSIAVRLDHELVALAIVGELVQSSGAPAVQALVDLGVRSIVMTGDDAQRIPGFEFAEIHARQSPQDKADRVRRLVAEGCHVAFVGDGVNDAAAMAESSVSVAVAAGAPLAVEVADAGWHAHDLMHIPEAIQLGRQTVQTIRANLLFAASYNFVGGILAIAGLLHPVVATILMTSSSLVVTWRAGGVAREDYAAALQQQTFAGSKPPATAATPTGTAQGAAG